MGVPRKTRLAAAVAARAAHHPGLSAQNIKYRLPELSGPMDRRSLFKALKLERQVVPAVNARACAGGVGCTLCFQECPAKAIERVGGRAVIIPERCVGCGACVPACPTGAVRFPGFTPDEQSAGLAALLAADQDGQSAPVITFISEKAEKALLHAAGLEDPYPPEVLPVSVPSLAILGVADLLESFARGSAAVALIGYGDAGSAGRRGSHLAEAMSYVDRLVRGESEIAQRVVKFELERDHPEKVLDALAAFCAQDRRTRPGPLSLPALPAAGPARVAGLVHLISTSAPRPGCVPAEGWAPFGTAVLDAEACTLCGLCAAHCPTGAIGFISTAEQELLQFRLDLCMACDLCAQMCPEKALKVNRTADPGVFGQPPRELAGAAMSHCRKCGDRLFHVKQGVRRPGHFASPSTLCPTCRIGASLFPDGMNALPVTVGTSSMPPRTP